MRKLVLVILSLAILSLIGCSSASSPAAASPQLVSSWDGHGDSIAGSSVKTTETFHISKGEWYIETSCEALNSGPIFFTASVFPKDKPVDNYSFIGIASQSTPGTATNYMHKKGDFYLSIVGINIKTWSVKVYQ